MMDIVGDKVNYQEYKENISTLEKEDVSVHRLTEGDEEHIVDLQTVIQRGSWKITPASSAYLQNKKHNRIRSSSWDNSLKVIYQLQKHSTHSVTTLGQVPEKRPSKPTSPYKIKVLNKDRLTRPQSGDLQKVKNMLFNPSHFSVSSFEGRNGLKLSQPLDSKRNIGTNKNIEENARSSIDGTTEGQLTKRNSILGAGIYKDPEVGHLRKAGDESVAVMTSGRNSPFDSELDPKVDANQLNSAGKAKLLKPSRTIDFNDYKESEDLDPEDVILETNKEGQKPFLQDSPEIITQKSDVSKDLRYNRDFFNKHILNKTGIPTITAKKREITGVWNLNKFASGQEISSAAKASDKGISMNVSLLKELASIEKQKALKMRMEQFVLLFNKKADLGINYLINSGLLEDTPEQIAQVLLVTEGLNKEMIGVYLGSHKEKNKQILKAYCQLLDFRNLTFDHALRLLLSRFKLPGEAQQIERIVQVFASVFHSDNPTVFNDEDTPFILAYSLLMLNTDAHSDTVQAKNKMTRHQFIENNIRICTTLTREYLGKMYDNIVKQKFETKADYIETIYNRLHQGHYSIQGETLKNIFDISKQLMEGAKFIKYGRKGKSHERKVWISEQENAILWSNLSKKNDKPRVIPFSEIRDILVGHNSTEVLVHNKVPSEFDSVTLSIVTTKRTLDLRAPNVETRVKWERYFRLRLLQRKGKAKGLSGEGKEKKQMEKEKLSEVWRIDILPNWEYHWDYENRKPKNLNQTYDSKGVRKGGKASKKSNHSGSPFWKFFGDKKKSGKKYDKSSLKNSDENLDEMRLEDDSFADTEFALICKNKSLLLVSLWKKGIPDWLRSILWPISIGNQLEITETLYEVLLSQAKIFLKESTLMKSSHIDSNKRMEADLEESLEIFPQLTHKKEAILNILEAFMFYRPDVGYVKGMVRLVMILLLYCSEYQAFSCFINLTHSHHFISFFRGIMREIEWRIRFFNKVFEEDLPHLYEHFKALDLSSEMFLLDWFLSLFSMAIFDADIISRIWDCFLLEGEVYAIKASVAILKYFELELKMLTFDGAIKFLKELPRDIDEDLLFSLIERVNVSWKDYQNELEAQKVAEINSKVHQALLEN